MGAGQLTRLDPNDRTLYTNEGARLRFDALLVAVGGLLVNDLEHAIAFRDEDAGEVYEGGRPG